MTAHTQFSHLPVAEQNRHVIAHLTPELWSKANRLHVRKAIAEFAHERLFTPECVSQPTSADEMADYQLAAPQDEVIYHFRARRLALEHWAIDADSIQKHKMALSKSWTRFALSLNSKTCWAFHRKCCPPIWKKSPAPYTAAPLNICAKEF